MRNPTYWEATILAGLLTVVTGCSGQPSAENTTQPSSSHTTPSSSSVSDVAMTSASAGDVGGPPPSIARPELSKSTRPGYESHTEIVNVILAAIEKKDQETLQKVRVDFPIYRDVYWPEFERLRPRNTLPIDFHWKLLEAKSLAGIQDKCYEFGGQKITLLEILPRRIEDWGSFKIWNRCKLRVRFEETGREDTIRVFGSLLEKDGRFWVVGYPS